VLVPAATTTRTATTLWRTPTFGCANAATRGIVLTYRRVCGLCAGCVPRQARGKLAATVPDNWRMLVVVRQPTGYRYPHVATAPWQHCRCTCGHALSRDRAQWCVACWRAAHQHMRTGVRRCCRRAPVCWPRTDARVCARWCVGACAGPVPTLYRRRADHVLTTYWKRADGVLAACRRWADRVLAAC
jgi:hypothetical protein